jgi:hypothetical protein
MQGRAGQICQQDAEFGKRHLHTRAPQHARRAAKGDQCCETEASRGAPIGSFAQAAKMSQSEPVVTGKSRGLVHWSEAVKDYNRAEQVVEQNRHSRLSKLAIEDTLETVSGFTHGS